MENTFVHPDATLNLSCNTGYVPSAIENVESLREFGVGVLCAGAVLFTLTLYFAVDACHNVVFQKDSRAYKTNVVMILAMYPIASVCSLTAIAMPRAQLLSEAVVQIFLALSLYRLYLVLVDAGRRRLDKTPPLMLRVGPCCCWPCLPLPTLEMTDANLSWLRALVLQLPVVQTLLYCVFLFMGAEEPEIVTRYGVFLQPLMVVSILVGIYGLTIATKSLHDVAPEARLRHKTAVSQMVLLFSKLQAGIVKGLAATGLFPCNPPITPQIYANVTSNALMLIEMLLLCYAARHVYYVELEKEEDRRPSDGTDRSRDKKCSVDRANNNEITGQHPGRCEAATA